MKIGITKKEFAYTPEAYAYKEFLEKNGHQVQFDYENNLDPNNDVNIFFMGLRPLWKKKEGKAIEIHEYQSLSTGKYPIIKDKIKALVNRKPDKRIFLNQKVHKGLGFNDKIPFIYRDMGVDSSFFHNQRTTPEYDIVYCGSINGRVGLVDVLIKLSAQYKVIIIGDVSKDIYDLFKSAGIIMTGRLSREFIPEIYSKCMYGLNYTPDIYPFNIQTSTKTLEYLASGLDVISNKYSWAEDFAIRSQIEFHWYNNGEIKFSSKENNYSFMRKYEWNSILNNVGFLNHVTLDI